jgi:hypothetical protein
MGRMKNIYDEEFLEWFRREALPFMMSHRLDMLNTFYEAYEDGFHTIVIDPDTLFSGTAEEEAMFMAVYEPKIPRKRSQPYIDDFEKAFIKYMNKKIQDDKNGKDS